MSAAQKPLREGAPGDLLDATHAASHHTAGGLTMSAAETKALMRRFIDEVMNRGNIAAIDELLAPDFVEYEEVPPG